MKGYTEILVLDKCNTFTLWLREEKNTAFMKANRSSQPFSLSPIPIQKARAHSHRIPCPYFIVSTLWEEKDEKSWGNKHRPHGTKTCTRPWRCWGLWGGDLEERTHSRGCIREMPWTFLTQNVRDPIMDSPCITWGSLEIEVVPRVRW